MVSSLMSFMCLLVMTCVTATRVAGGDLALTTHDENEEMTQMTCKTGSSNFCNGDWKYLGNENCCTSKWAQCTKGSFNFCNGAWKYLGNDQCCITSDYQVSWDCLRCFFSHYRILYKQSFRDDFFFFSR